MLSRKIPLLSGYWHYWLNAVNEHSLHAPFAFHFYTKIVKPDEIHSEFFSIEAVRNKFLHSKKIIQLHDPEPGSLNTRCHQRQLKDITRNSLTPPKYSRLLYRIARHMQAKHIVELGTSLGINTLYLSSAAPESQLYTFDGCEATADEAQQVFEWWHLKNIHMETGNIDQNLPALLQHIPQIDLLYINADHHYTPTIQYYEHCKKKAHKSSIFILNGIYWSKEMKKTWQHMRHDPLVSLSLDLFGVGIIFFRKLYNKQHHLLMF